MIDGGQTASCAQPGDVETGNIAPLLHQIRHALHGLIESGEDGVIDLGSIPMGPGEEDRLLEALGQGEVRIQLSALGPSEIVETTYPGVWVVIHYNSDREVIGKYIEVCEVPRLVMAQSEDMRAGLTRLEERLV